jgi:hypothetical protein
MNDPQTHIPDPLTTAAEASSPERKLEDGGHEYVAFAGCTQGRSRLLKVAQPDTQPYRIACPVDGCAEGFHWTFQPRPRRPGEECEISVSQDAGPPAEPARKRMLKAIGDDEILAAIQAEDKPVPVVMHALGLSGSGDGVRLRERAEWINFDAGCERIVITRQGSPKPTLLRRAEA